MTCLTTTGRQRLSGGLAAALEWYPTVLPHPLPGDGGAARRGAPRRARRRRLRAPAAPATADVRRPLRHAAQRSAERDALPPPRNGPARAGLQARAAAGVLPLPGVLHGGVLPEHQRHPRLAAHGRRPPRHRLCATQLPTLPFHRAARLFTFQPTLAAQTRSGTPRRGTSRTSSRRRTRPAAARTATPRLRPRAFCRATAATPTAFGRGSNRHAFRARASS